MAAATGTVVISQGGSNFDSATYPRFVLGDGTNSLTFVIDNDGRGLKLTGGADADGYSSASDLPFEDSQKTRLVVPTFDEADGAKKALLAFWITDEAQFDDAFNGVSAASASAITAIGTRPHFVLRDAAGNEMKIGGGNADATSLSNSSYTLLAKYGSSGSPRFWLYRKDSTSEYFIRIVTTGSNGWKAHMPFLGAIKHANDNSLINITARGVKSDGTLMTLSSVANDTYTASETHGIVMEYDTAGFAGNACYMEFKDPNTDFDTAAKTKCMSWGYSEYATTNVYTINRHSLSPTNDQFWGTNLNSKIWFRQGTIAGSGSDASLSTANIAEAIKEMINGSYLGITATRSGSTVNLTNDTDGDSGNVNITTTNEGSLFTVSGMSNAGGGGSEESDVARRSTISADQLALSASGGLASSSDNKSAIKLDLKDSLTALGASPDSTDLLAVADASSGAVTKITVAELVGSVAAGSDTQVQFNDGGASLGGDAGLTYNKTTDTLSVGNDLKLTSDSAILSLGAGDDATLTHDGTTGLTIAATPISIDSTGELHLNSTTGDVKFQDGGTDQLALDMDGSAGEIIMKLMVDSDDFVFQQYDGTEVFRVEDNGDFDVAGGAGSSGVTITSAGVLTADGRIIVDDATDATSTTDGSLQTDGGLSVAKDVVAGNDVKLLSDSAVLSMGAGSDITFTHDGTTGLTIAATPISIDSTGELHLNSTTGDIKLQDGGVDQIAFDLDGTAGEVIMKPAVDSDDLVFAQYDGTEVIRIEDNGAVDFAGGAGSSGVTVSAAGQLTADGRVIIDDATDATSATDGSLQTDGGLSVVKDIIAGNDVKLLSDSAVLAMGAGSDITLTHDGSTGGTLASAGAFLIDGANAVSIDGASGVNIGTNDSGAAISIGHSTSEVTVNDNLTVTGDLTVRGTTTTVDSTTIHISQSFTFEGPADDHETTLHAGTPTQDLQVNLPQFSASAGAATYHLPVLADATTAAAAAVTAAEFALLDGASSIGTSALAAADGFMHNDNGTMKHTKIEKIGDFLAGGGTAGIGVSSGVLEIDIAGMSALGGASIAQADEFMFSDAGTEKKVTFSNLEDSIFGNVSGQAAVAAGGALSLDVSAITAQTEMTGDVADADEFMISDGGVLKRADFSVIRDAVFNDVSGDAAIADGGALTIQADAVESGMLNDNVISGQTELASDGLAAADEMMISDAGTLKKIGVDNLFKDGPGLLSAATVAVGDDHIMFLDGGATGDAKTESIADLISGVASNGLQASSGQLSITSVEDHFMSSSGANGGKVFTLTQTPASNASVSVYINGIFQVQSGSHATIGGGDYSISGTTVTLVNANAIDASDEVVVKYVQQ